MFSGFSEDVSEFNLSSEGNVRNPILDNFPVNKPAKDYLKESEHVTNGSRNVGYEIDNHEQNHKAKTCVEYECILLFLIEKLMERVQDDQSEEVLVLNLELDHNILNSVMR